MNEDRDYKSVQVAEKTESRKKIYQDTNLQNVTILLKDKKKGDPKKQTQV